MHAGGHYGNFRKRRRGGRWAAISESLWQASIDLPPTVALADGMEAACERSRPTLGLPILKAMRPTKPGLWEGDVYNAENGKTYSSRISLTAPDVLRIEGCVLGGLICGGQNWTRVNAANTAPDARAAPPAARTPVPPTRAPRPAPATSTLTACSGVTQSF